MIQFQFKYWFEHGGGCIWGVNTIAKEKYGYCINFNTLPISKELVLLLVQLEKEYYTYLDWEYPPNPSPWSEELKKDFVKRATDAYNDLCEELGENYIVENAMSSCVY